jgi:hypothetical protein
MEVPPFLTWIRTSIATTIKKKDIIEKDVVQMSMPLALEANPYQAMWVYSNYIHVSSVEEHLTTCDNGVAAIYEQKCVFGPKSNACKVEICKMG